MKKLSLAEAIGLDKLGYPNHRKATQMLDQVIQQIADEEFAGQKLRTWTSSGTTGAGRSLHDASGRWFAEVIWESNDNEIYRVRREKISV